MERWNDYERMRFVGKTPFVTFERIREDDPTQYVAFAVSVPSGSTLNLDPTSAYEIETDCGRFRSTDIACPRHWQVLEVRLQADNEALTIHPIDFYKEPWWETVKVRGGGMCYVFYVRFDFGDCDPKKIRSWNEINFTWR
jgi:hypothetical protein